MAKLKDAVGRVEKGVLLDDPSHHTKWINHMAPRLYAARKLLKHTGVMIVSIDEHELPLQPWGKLTGYGYQQGKGSCGSRKPGR